jgi:hypothetical protein
VTAVHGKEEHKPQAALEISNAETSRGFRALRRLRKAGRGLDGSGCRGVLSRFNNLFKTRQAGQSKLKKL